MDLESQLVHAEPGQRVVLVRAQRDGQSLGSALGEGSTAEEAEDRAIQRLNRRLSQPMARGTRDAKPEADSAADPDRRPPEPIQAASPPRPKAPAKAVAPAKPVAEAKAVAESKPVAEPLLPPIAGMAASAAVSAAGTAAGTATEAPEADPEDWSSELARLDLQLQRLGWSREQEGIYLERAFGHPSRNRLTLFSDLMAHLTTLESLAPGADPTTASVPLRRRDLLGQCDQLLAQLQWDASTGRSFLEQHFSLTSRQQLSDSQLLQFNMLLEGELMGL